MNETYMSENVRIAASQFLEEKEYWLEKLAGKPVKSSFYYDYPAAGAGKRMLARFPFQCGDELFAGLTDLSKGSPPRLHMILTAALAALLAKYTGGGDILLGTSIDKQDIESGVQLVNTILPLRFRLSENITFKELLLQVRATINGAIDNQNYPVETLGIPLFDTALILENIQDKKYLDHLDNNLVFCFRQDRQTIQCTAEFNTALYSSETIRRLSRHFNRLLEIVINDIHIKITGIGLMSEQEKKQCIDFNNTRAGYPEDKTIHRLFEEQAARTPDHVALIGPKLQNTKYKIQTKYKSQITNNKQSSALRADFDAFGGAGLSAKSQELIALTYKELNEKSRQLAYALREKGVKPGTIAAIEMEPSLDAVVALLAILKTGAAFLPIDPGYPEERKQYMLKDSNAKMLLTGLPEGRGFHHSSSCIHHGNSLAYVIYTSGSTGRPKGVMVEHRGLVNYACWAARHYIKNPADRFAFYTSIAFDLTMTSIFAPLTAGSTIVIYRGEQREFLIQRIIREKTADIVKVTPTHLKLIRGIPGEQPAPPLDIKRFIVGGEQLETQLAREIHANANGNVEIYNEYGPTEAVVGCMLYRFDPGADTGIAVPIGKPADNVNIYLLDKNRKPLPTGVPGEIFIAGAGIARGYLNHPELTAEKFIMPSATRGSFEKPPLDPAKLLFNHYSPITTHQSPLYRTGDLARWTPDGNLEFLGRIDDQVKIRGYRIEPAEIQNRLLNHPGVKDTVVLALGEDEENMYLCAYFVPTPGGADGLREYLSQWLPDYMIPSYFVPLDRLPVDLGGKIHRHELPHPGESTAGSVEYKAPRTDTERIMAGVWGKILGVEQVGIDDGYFALGGDSVKAIQIAASLQQHRLKMEIADLFRYPNIAELSPLVTPIRRGASQEPVWGPVPLTPIQHWFFQKDPGKNHPFNMPVMLFREQGFDKDILAYVFTRLLEHHDALRMEYDIREGAPVSQFNRDISTAAQLATPGVYDLENHADWENIMQEKSARIMRSVNISQRDSLVKPCLFKTPAGDYLLIAVHHLVVDAVSWRIIFQDFKILYNARENGEEAVLPPKTASFKEWAEKLRYYAGSQQFLQEFAYWEKIEQTPYTLLPRDNTPAKDKNCIKYSRQEKFILSPEYTEMLLKDVNQAYNTEINDILLTALGLAVKEWAGMDTVPVNLEGHGREDILPDIDITRTIGWFTSLYPIIIDLQKASDPASAIKTTKEMLRHVPGKGTGYGVLKYLTDPAHKKGLTFERKPEIGFNYLGRFDEDINPDFFRVVSIPTGSAVNPESERDHALEIRGIISGQVLTITAGYNKEEFNRGSITAFMEKYREHLQGLIDHCAAKKETELTVSDLSSTDFSEEEMDAILEGLDN